MQSKVLIIGSEGQLGSELAIHLQIKRGTENIVCADLRASENKEGIFEKIDVLDREGLEEIIKKHQITEIYHLAAMLSATGEAKPKLAWKLNMDGLINVLDLALKYKIEKVYWPSSIAVFGPDTPKINTPQNSYANPNTVYGISKLAGEMWCQYYFEKFGLDVRSLRYPGVISYKTLPGGGTTDYAIDIFHQALKQKKYTCFLSENQRLPMMYVDDAIRATIELMEAPKENIKARTSYNLSAISFTPKELATEIKKHIPDFEIDYKTDNREAIAASWSDSIDDSAARNDWNWKHEFDLEKMTKTMLEGLS